MVVPDRVMVARLWPLLAAAATGLVPFTLFSTLVVDIAADAGTSDRLLGGLRGLGGVAALVVGLAAAPLLDRLSRRVVVLVALTMLGLGCLLGLVGSVWAWVVFCLVVGAATSVLNPSLAALAADTYRDPATSGRAATLVSATTTLTAVLSGPLLVWPSAWWGWRGSTVAVVAVCAVVAVLVARWPVSGGGSQRSTAATGYLAGFGEVARIPGVVPLLGVSALRTTVFMGQLAYAAVWYHDRFGWGSAAFAGAWTASGVAFFVGNWVAGRQLARQPAHGVLLRVMAVAAAVAAGAQAVLFLTGQAWVAVACTALVALGHSVVAAGVTSLLVRDAGDRRGTVMGLNGVGQSLGVFTGAALVAAGLALAEWPGVAVVLAATMLVCLPCLALAGRRDTLRR